MEHCSWRHQRFTKRLTFPGMGVLLAFARQIDMLPKLSARERTKKVTPNAFCFTVLSIPFLRLSVNVCHSNFLKPSGLSRLAVAA